MDQVSGFNSMTNIRQRKWCAGYSKLVPVFGGFLPSVITSVCRIQNHGRNDICEARFNTLS